MAALALLSHWRRQPLQFVTLVVGLALATALWSAVQAINAEARASYAKASGRLSAAAVAVIEAPGGRIPVATYARLRRDGWAVSPVLQGRLQVEGARFDLVGLDVLTHPAAEALSGPDGSPLAALTQDGRVFAAPELAKTLAGSAMLPPVFAEAAVPVGEVWTDIAVAERLLGRSTLSHLLVLDRAAITPDALAAIAPNLQLRETAEGADTAQLTRSFHLNLTAFGFLAFTVGLFIVHGAIGLAFEQRRSLFRTLRALGVPLSRLMLILAVELLGLALIAALFGLAVGHFIAGALLPDVAATLRGLYGAEVAGALVLRWDWALAGVAMALGGAGVAGAGSLMRLRRLPLLQGATVSVWAREGLADHRRMAAVGLGLACAGAVCLWLFSGLLAGFGLLAGMLLGAALCLPWVLDHALRLGAACAKRPLAQWVWADARAQVPGMSLALMALMLALATNVGVSTMVSSFRLTFIGWLDQRLAPEVYLTARNDAEGDALETWLQGRVDAVLPIRSAQTRLFERRATVFGIVDNDSYAENWPLLTAQPDVWAQVHAGQGVLINEQLARREGLTLGDAIPLAGVPMPVAGIYSDYGNPDAQAMIAMPELLRRFGPVPNTQFGLRISPDAIPGFRQDLQAAFTLPAGGFRINTEVKRASLAVFEKTFLVTGALNALTLGVAGFAILTSLLTLWTSRLPQIAPVWALGLTRRNIALIELGRSLLLAAFSSLVAVPVGLALAWTLLNVINVEAFGWQLPMFLFPLDWVVLTGLALTAAGLAALWPAWRVARVPPAMLLKVFANDR